MLRYEDAAASKIEEIDGNPQILLVDDDLRAAFGQIDFNG